MNIVKVYPKDIHAVIDFSKEDLIMLLDFLDSCVVDYGNGDENLRKAGEYVTKELFPKLNQLCDDLEAMK
jgi:hypothetical protein